MRISTHSRAILAAVLLVALDGFAAADENIPAPPGATTVTSTDNKGGLRAQQQMLAALATQPGAEADRVLLAQFDRYREHDLPPALWLELFEAAAKSANPNVKARLAEHEREVEKSRDPLIPYRECLEGGDAAAGRAIFDDKPEAGCIRCHRVSGKGGEIGPDLSGLRQATQRIFILESIVDPNAIITPGFQNVLLTLKNGESLSGLATFESTDDLILTSVVDGKKRKLKLADIAERIPLPSAMPPGFGLVLGKRAIRDLVEFLATVE